jgi:hypothetical protein
VVSQKDVVAIELDDVLGDPVVSQQADDPGHFDTETDRVDPVLVVVAFSEGRLHFTGFSPGFEIVGAVVTVLNIDDFGGTLDEQAEGTASGDDLDGNVAPVERENVGLESRGTRRHHLDSPVFVAS